MSDIAFFPVMTVSDLETLEPLEDIRDGYWSGFNGEPEPGHNRGRAYWHGWRNGMLDSGRMEKDEAQARLAKDVIATFAVHPRPQPKETGDE